MSEQLPIDREAFEKVDANLQDLHAQIREQGADSGPMRSIRMAVMNQEGRRTAMLDDARKEAEREGKMRAAGISEAIRNDVPVSAKHDSLNEQPAPDGDKGLLGRIKRLFQ